MRGFEEVMRIDAVMAHQAGQRRAVVEIVFLLQRPRLVVIEPKKLGDIGRHVLVDLGEEIDMMRIERVVEIEYPVGHMGEIGLGGKRGLCGHVPGL